jgi:putative DNA primase/helicase
MGVLEVQPQHIPAELRALERWAVWHHEVDDRGHLSKPPFQANHSGERAYASAPETWASFDAAYTCYCQHRDTYEGISFAITDLDDIIGVDLDHIDEHWPEPLEIVRTLMSYTEVSPSREGLRILCRGSLPAGRRIREWVEMYSSKRFLTITGAWLESTPAVLEQRTSELWAIWEFYVQQSWRGVLVRRG